MAAGGDVDSGEERGFVISRILTILALLVGLSTLAASQHSDSLTTAQSQPNFVVILVDDLDSDSVSRMPAVNRLLRASGVTFTRFFATTPLCCPSRASILRGQYAHNHRVLRNTGEDAGFAAFYATGHETETIATTLDGAGYETALVGKYLNGYANPRSANTYIPPGWDYWVAGVDHDAYNSFNYDLNVNGELVSHGRNERDYLTDVLSAHALGFLDRSTGSGQPFFLYLAPYAPHSPATPAPRHKGMFAGETAPRGPAFNERNIQDKPDWVQSSRLSDERISRIDSGYQDRLESLMAVDEMVDVVVARLNEHGVLDSTYVVFLSDNGYFLGEHRQPHGKDAPYDAASRVPMIVRGPGIAAGTTVEKIALNIDLFPTIAELAGVAVPSFVDGRSLTPLLVGHDADWREVGLIEGFGKETESNEGSESSTPAFRALRSENTMFAEYETGERELYDLRTDRHQISNIARNTPKALLREYSRRLDALVACAGSECSRLEDEPLSKRPGKATAKGEDKSKAKAKAKGKDNGKGKGKARGKDKTKEKTKGKAKRRDGPTKQR
jgi:arylsulfatase A-like enzyme